MAFNNDKKHDKVVETKAAELEALKDIYEKIETLFSENQRMLVRENNIINELIEKIKKEPDDIVADGYARTLEQYESSRDIINAGIGNISACSKYLNNVIAMLNQMLMYYKVTGSTVYFEAIGTLIDVGFIKKSLGNAPVLVAYLKKLTEEFNKKIKEADDLIVKTKQAHGTLRETLKNRSPEAQAGQVGYVRSRRLEEIRQEQRQKEELEKINFNTENAEKTAILVTGDSNAQTNKE